MSFSGAKSGLLLLVSVAASLAISLEWLNKPLRKGAAVERLMLKYLTPTRTRRIVR